jgi:pilus assembly protein TadC
MYRYLSKFYPTKIRDEYVALLRYSDIRINAERFIGFVGAAGFLLSLALSFYSSIFLSVSPILLFFGFFVLIQIMVYFLLMLKADGKGKFVEDILPDVLQLMASNLRAGFTTDKALLLAARPEFGPFQAEITKVGKEVTMGRDIGKALIGMTKRIKSERFSKTITLVVTGLRSGGELASLLEQTAKNLRQEMLVDNRIRANVMMYVIFIFIAVCMGAPLLFGLSSFLVQILTQSLGSVDIPADLPMESPINFTEVGITTEFVILFSVVFLITSSILGSLILGLIAKGKARDGIKFMPAIIIVSLIVFFLTRIVMKGVLGGLFTY